MTLERLHRDVATVLPAAQQATKRILLHALIDLGIVTALRCQYRHCLLEPGFDPAPRQPRSLSFDHCIPLSEGGSDRPNNIRVLHFTCNAIRGSRVYYSDPDNRATQAARITQINSRPAVRAMRSTQMIEKWQDPVLRERMQCKPLTTWSKQHDKCVSCNTTDRKHKGHGLCTACHQRRQESSR